VLNVFFIDGKITCGLTDDVARGITVLEGFFQQDFSKGSSPKFAQIRMNANVCFKEIPTKQNV